MTSRKDRIRTYFDGFRQGDHDKILALLTGDVVWGLYGYRHLRARSHS